MEVEHGAKRLALVVEQRQPLGDLGFPEIYFSHKIFTGRYLAKFRLVENRNKRNITCGMLIHKTNFLWFHTTLRIGTVCEIQEYIFNFFSLK